MTNEMCFQDILIGRASDVFQCALLTCVCEDYPSLQLDNHTDYKDT